MDFTAKEIAERDDIGYCCEGCDRVTPNYRCSAYLYPENQWAHGGCAMATHIKKVETTKLGKVRVGQQKQRKR